MQKKSCTRIESQQSGIYMKVTSPIAYASALVGRPVHHRLHKRRDRDIQTSSARPALRVQTAKALKPDSISVQETIRLAQQGDAAAFESLYELHSRRVYSLCLRMIGDPTEAEDLTQEAFLQLFRKIHTFRGESAFSSWLYRLTANIVLMRFRKKRPVPVSLDEMTRTTEEKERPILELGEPDARLVGLFDRLNLQGAVERLPEGYRSMFLLHDVHGYEHNEIASLLGCSVGNSKSQLHKARKRLRELLHEVHHYTSNCQTASVLANFRPHSLPSNST
jgi:RNA polymerase sigma-70 factor, ECF subfamily